MKGVEKKFLNSQADFLIENMEGLVEGNYESKIEQSNKTDQIIKLRNDLETSNKKIRELHCKLQRDSLANPGNPTLLKGMPSPKNNSRVDMETQTDNLEAMLSPLQSPKFSETGIVLSLKNLDIPSAGKQRSGIQKFFKKSVTGGSNGRKSLEDHFMDHQKMREDEIM